MEITQELVNKIIKRARNSEYGLDEGLIHKQNYLQVDIYSEGMSPYDMLSNLLVNGWDSKYDLISVFKAAFEVIEEEIKKDTAKYKMITPLDLHENKK